MTRKEQRKQTAIILAKMDVILANLQDAVETSQAITKIGGGRA